MLERVRGLALLGEGRLEAARERLDESLGLGRRLGAEYEVALTLDALVRLERVEGGSNGGAEAAEAHEILERLGVIALPAALDAVEQRASAHSG
jgi:hypothetical protein